MEDRAAMLRQVPTVKADKAATRVRVVPAVMAAMAMVRVMAEMAVEEATQPNLAGTEEVAGMGGKVATALPAPKAVAAAVAAQEVMVQAVLTAAMVVPGGTVVQAAKEVTRLAIARRKAETEERAAPVELRGKQIRAAQTEMAEAVEPAGMGDQGGVQEAGAVAAKVETLEKAAPEGMLSPVRSRVVLRQVQPGQVEPADAAGAGARQEDLEERPVTVD
jgi:hypothetical protein